ncbi:MAG: hypothetical protein KME29_02040 [Calothrix sp. FI2-JRJ7]|jgi:hypothetical protein|nr:hypothetical protein [Calothrix sp. FI2-JRJ7]
MNAVTFEQERFQLQDIPTQLNYLAKHLDQIQSLTSSSTDPDKIVSLMRESRYYIEWIVSQLVDIDIDSSFELVDLGRVLTRWLFDWSEIWTNPEARTEVATVAQNWSLRLKKEIYTS